MPRLGYHNRRQISLHTRQEFQSMLMSHDERRRKKETQEIRWQPNQWHLDANEISKTEKLRGVVCCESEDQKKR